jgi:hypothetical protein
MDVPEVAPAVLGEIITMAVAPVFLISALIVLLGLLSSRSMRIIDSIFELAGERALSPHDPLLALQKRRLRHISLAFREAVIATAMVCLVVLLLFLNVMVAMDLAPLVSYLFIAAMLLVIHALIMLYRELQLALAAARRHLPGGF